MKNLDAFTNSLVIDYQSSLAEFGHYPFQMFVETEHGENIFASMLLGGQIHKCYENFKQHYDESAKRIYMSADFPSSGDMENDFIAIFSYEDSELSVTAIPYDTEDGKILPFNEVNEHLLEIFNQFVSSVHK